WGGGGGVGGWGGVDMGWGGRRGGVAADLAVAVQAADRGAGVVVCCDLHGSTPANCAVELMRAKLPDVDLAVISGVSMPMLMKLATAQRSETTPAGLAKAAVDTAIRSIRIEGAEAKR